MSFIPVYILILVALILIDYTLAILIDKNQGKKRTLFLVLSIISTCLVLFIFKYFNFFNANFTELATLIHWNYSISSLSLILPIGLSFHTFQSLSYVIEVFLGRQKPEKNLGIYSLYVMFYPQLVAGPIERPQNLLHQFYEHHKFDYAQVISGLRLMLWGFFKKVVIADRLAVLVNTVYNDPTSHSGFPLILATVFFAFQIYCDFSGYTDIARGAARIMGFRLMKNFDNPYFSKSISEFWNRWHISLSSWFRDYLYTPLIGKRLSMKRLYFSLIIVFLVSGIWHGANWTFAIWGLLHGGYLVISILTQNARNKVADKTGLSKHPLLHNILKIVIIFILACLGWVFFRANTVTDAFYILTHLFTNFKASLFNTNLGLTYIEVFLGLSSIVFMILVEYFIAKKSVETLIDKRALWIRWIIYILLIVAILLFGVFNNTKFIYFQF
jgi:D-alanyl-lipoteichoic acid acyltransferase DltB (MBOAT superfamily)